MTKEIDIEAFTTSLNGNILILLLIRLNSSKASAILFLINHSKCLVPGLQAHVKVFFLFLLHSKFIFVGFIFDTHSESEFNLERFLSNPLLQELKSLKKS